jgi:membrane protease YdiL (CAAX protease family)
MIDPPDEFPHNTANDSESRDAVPEPNPDPGPQIPHDLPATFPPGDGHVGDIQAGDVLPPEQPLFSRYRYVPPRPLPPRRPNFGDLLVFLLIASGALFLSEEVVLTALHYHLFGVTTLKQAESEIHYKIGSQAAWYLISLLFCTLIFPLLWRKTFFQGIQWRASAAAQNLWRLFGAAGACFLGAIADEILIPGPANTPIDTTFHIPGAIWLLFGFGVTLAPLLEEIAYRGFLLPSLCTAWDWINEQFAGLPPRTDPSGRPRWSLPAMVAASIVTSIPFALMHGQQTAYSVGPFLLLFAISLVLCWIRLTTQSLAASVLVHSSYNLLLFALMFLGTGGFRHLDRM